MVLASNSLLRAPLRPPSLRPESGIWSGAREFGEPWRTPFSDGFDETDKMRTDWRLWKGLGRLETGQTYDNNVP